MIYDNVTNHLRDELIKKVTKAYLDDDLRELDLIPIKMRPKGGDHSRCCVYKDRAMLRFRCLGTMGISAEEDDELTSLQEYGEKALERNNIELPVISVIHEGCSACVQAHYLVTNACHGCIASPCILNCPKDSIEKVHGKAIIDHKTCINCGKCLKVCPYNAIIHVPIPCREACPTDALSKDEHGVVRIDYDKCIYCGKCILACPFGAVIEKSQIVDIIKSIKGGKEVVAMLAPSIIGQFKGSLKKLSGALKKFGFSEVIEVAVGADKTSLLESKEYLERMEEGDSFMTSSCCPAYTEIVEKHIPELKTAVSSTSTPMYYTEKIVKEQIPEAETVFIGPCIAKRMEAIRDHSVDYVLTYEELDSLFAAKEIIVSDCEENELMGTGMKQGREFPVSGGIISAINSLVKDKTDMKPIQIDGLTHKTVNLLKVYSKGKCPGNFVEVMACEGGCVCGPGTVANPKVASVQLKKLLEESEDLKNEEEK